MNVSVPTTNAPAVQGINNPNNGTAPTYAGYTGNGVIIGVVDTGLDLANPDFHSSAPPSSRVLFLWDQLGFGVQPTGFSYGAEFTQAQINANPNVSNDLDGSGTHLTGIAAANGRATGNGKLAYRYIGMAPKADLIIVRSGLTDLQITDGVDYIFRKADALGKKAVVLVSKTNQRGAHDGSSTLDLALSALTGTAGGKLIVAPVGDEGLDAIHAKINLASGGSGAFNFTIPTYTNSTGEDLIVEAWHKATASFQVRITTPSGFQSAWIQPGGTTGTVVTTDGAYILQNDVETSSTGAKKIQFEVYWQGGTTARPKIGAYTLDVQRLGPATTGRLDAWVSKWKFNSGNVSPYFTTNIDHTMKVGSPATALKVVAVSAYTTRSTWINPLGQTSFFGDNPQIGGFYEKCNSGPRWDLSTCPDVCAPGEGIMSSLDSYIAPTISVNSRGDDNVHYIVRSSKQAAAHVVGALALRLQQVPTTTPEQAKEFLGVLARPDTFTGSVPNNLWGYGKLYIDTTNPPRGISGTGKLPSSYTEA